MSIRSIHWPHLVACLLVAVTAVLLCFGALVTTFDAAMAVPDWPATYGHNMFLFPLAEWLHGPWDLFLEHGHRLLGAAAGMVTLVLAAATFLQERRRIVRWLVVAAVALVIVQGLLGGARVLLDDRTIAKVHACTGPLFFAVAVAIASLTSSGSGAGRRSMPDRFVEPGVRPGDGNVLPASSAGLLAASYIQLVAGAQLRHLDASLDPQSFRQIVVVHLAGAAVVAALSAVSAAAAWRRPRPAPRGWATGILLLVAFQVLLGGAAWVANWGVPAVAQGTVLDSLAPAGPVVARSLQGSVVVTLHVVLGMAILAASVVLAIRAGGSTLASTRLEAAKPQRAGAVA
jgi:cytochrome c oxidase assembly protein subunit 15